MISVRRSATPDEVARHYDELHRIYLEAWGEHLHHGLFQDGIEDPQEAAGRLVSLVARLGRIGPGDRVCDIGCGYGATARELALTHGARVTGITLSSSQADHATARAPAGADLLFHQGDWLANPFEDACFDVALAVECLAHMADQKAFFREAARTLRPGGRLVVCAWMAGDGVGFLGRRLLLEPLCREGQLAGLATEHEIRTLMDAAGFRLERFLDLSFAVRRTWSVSIRRMLRVLLRPRHLVLLGDPGFHNRRFALAVFRIWIAYRVHAMRYGVFVARRG